MLYFYTGTDVKKIREEMNREVALVSKGARVVRINDTNSTDDLYAALQGGGLFGEKHVFIIDSISENEEMLAVLLQMLEGMKESE